MNEQELKAIWQKEEKISLENFNFETIKNRSLESQNKLRQRIKNEVIFGAVLYVFLIPIFYFFPKVMLFIPVFIAVWVWYLWELNRIYKLDTDFQSFENFKEFLQIKRTYLKGYFRRTRYFTWVISPPLLLFSFIIFTSWELIIQNPYPFLRILVLSQIVIVIFVELWLWFVYRPYLVEIEDLLRQLDETQ